jgi:hypothetical protein
MLIEDTSTKCPHCKIALTWKSHIKRWEHGRCIHEFTFRCESCRREYLLKDDQVVEKKQGRDLSAENLAIQRGQLQDAINRRCIKCGGPITDGNGLYALRCEWCSQEYSIIGGELLPKIEPSPQPKPSMRQFYLGRDSERQTIHD